MANLRGKKSLQNFLASSARSVLGMGLGLVTTPFILRYLGEEKFGLFRTLNDLFGYLSLLEMGLFGGLLSSLVAAIGKKNGEEQKGILHWGLRSYFRISGISLLIGLCALPLVSYFTHGAQSGLDFYLGYLLILLSYVVIPLHVFRAYHDANQNSALTNASLMVYSMVFSMLAVLFAHIGLGISGQALATLLAFLLSYLILMRKTPFTMKEIFRSSFHAVELKEKLQKLKSANFWCDLAGKVCLLSDTILITAMLGPIWVVPFTLSQKLPQLMQSQLQNLGAAVWASMAEIYYEGHLDLFALRLIELNKVISIISGVGIVPIFIASEPFLHLWVGQKYYAGHLFLFLVCLNAYFLALFTLWGWLFTATGHIEQLVRMMISQAVVNLIGSVSLTYFFGIIGPIAGTSLAYVLIPLWWLPLLIKKNYHVNMGHFSWACAWPALTFLFIGVALHVFGVGEHMNSWPRLIFGTGILTVVLFLLSYFFLLKTTEREIFRARLKKMFPSRS